MHLLKLAEKLFVIISLLLFSDAVISIVRQPGSSGDRLLSPTSILLYSIQIISILLLIARWKQLILTVKESKLLWCLIALILISIVWSAAPSETFRGSLGLMRLTIFGVYFSASFSIREQLRLLAYTLGCATLLSILCALLLPEYGLMGGSAVEGLVGTQGEVHLGAWQGVYSHKNILGRFMSLGVLVFWLVANSKTRLSLLAWSFFGLSFSLVLLSTSTTSLLIGIVIIVILPLYKGLRWNFNLALPAFLSLSVISGSMITFLVSQQGAILGLLGKDSTLTGRSDIWEAVTNKIRERLLLGYGYGGFWTDENGEGGSIWKLLGWNTPHSHNGFIDLTLDLGLIGLVVFLIGFCVTFTKAVNHVRLTKTADGLFPIAFLTFMILSNLTESALLRANVLWILYVSITVSLQNQHYHLLQFQKLSYLETEDKPATLKV